jgi:hypothetical protein
MDSILYDGIDPLALRRAHLRELTTARQAAERRLVRRDSSIPHDGASRAVAARERAVAFQIEMDRINVDHRSWQHEQSEDVTELPERQHRAASSAVPDLAAAALGIDSAVAAQ